MSYAACLETESRVRPVDWRGPGILTASLAGAAATLCLSGVSLVYAFTHIPEVDPDAQPAPVAAIAAAAPVEATKLEVLTPPVYGPGVVDEAPAAPLILASATGSARAVPMNARVGVDTVDMAKLAEADGVAAPCADPCAAQAGYIVPDAPDETREPRSAPRDAVVVREDDDGGDTAPPPPDIAIN
jgi:hypothetical protein